MINKSNMDIAYDIVSASKEPIPFAELWNKLCEMQGYTKEEADNRISSFYTSLLLDGRFVNIGDNTWDLRSRYKFDETTLDVNECYTEDEDTETEDADEVDEDEKKAKEALGETTDSSDDDDKGSEYEAEETE